MGGLDSAVWHINHREVEEAVKVATKLLRFFGHLDQTLFSAMARGTPPSEGEVNENGSCGSCFFSCLYSLSTAQLGLIRHSGYIPCLVA